MDSIIHLDWESAKEVRKVAENSTYLQLDSFEINTGKLQGSERVIVAQLLEKLSSLESDQNSVGHITEVSITEN